MKLHKLCHIKEFTIMNFHFKGRGEKGEKKNKGQWRNRERRRESL
jgi:hypothetical protein